MGKWIVDGEYVRVAIARLHQWPNDVNAYAFHRCLRLRLDVVLRLRWNLTVLRFVFACMMQNGLVAMEQAQDGGDHGWLLTFG